MKIPQGFVYIWTVCGESSLSCMSSSVLSIDRSCIFCCLGLQQRRGKDFWAAWPWKTNYFWHSFKGISSTSFKTEEKKAKELQKHTLHKSQSQWFWCDCPCYLVFLPQILISLCFLRLLWQASLMADINIVSLIFQISNFKDLFF